MVCVLQKIVGFVPVAPPAGVKDFQTAEATASGAPCLHHQERGQPAGACFMIAAPTVVRAVSDLLEGCSAPGEGLPPPSLVGLRLKPVWMVSFFPVTSGPVAPWDDWEEAACATAISCLSLVQEDFPEH